MTQAFAARPYGTGAGVTAVVAAIPEEAAVLRRELWGTRRIRTPFDTVTGWLGRAPLALAVTGDGERNAYEGLCTLLRSSLDIRRVLVVGVSGALSQTLRAESLVVAERVVQEDGEVTLDANEALVAGASRLCVAPRAVVISAQRLADTPAAKRRLLDLIVARGASGARGPSSVVDLAPQPSAAPRLAVVDLESAAYARAAHEAGVPWLCLRAISDTAEEGLPALLERCRDGGGAVQRGRVARRLFREPRALPALLSLRRRVRRCAGVLERAARALTAEWAQIV